MANPFVVASWANRKKVGRLAKNLTKTVGKGFKKSKLFIKSATKPKTTKTTVHTKHYKTGERLGVLTRNQRRKYEQEAAGRTFESEVAKRKNKENNKNQKNKTKTTVHTRHYKTGERLGVLTRNQRRQYEQEAAGRTFESEVAKRKNKKNQKNRTYPTLLNIK